MILYLLFSNFPVKLICKKPGTVEINIPMVKDSIALRTTCCQFVGLGINKEIITMSASPILPIISDKRSDILKLNSLFAALVSKPFVLKSKSLNFCRSPAT